MTNLRGISGALLPYSENQEVLRVGPFQHGSAQAAINAAPAGAVIELTPGAYSESVTINKALALVCRGARGACAIGGIQVLADDVSLYNVGTFADSEADYALQVGSATVSPDRFRAYGCKFEGPDAAAVILKGAGDALLEDCEFAWAGSGLLFSPNNDGFCTQIFIERCRFHNLTTVGIGLDTSGGVVNMHLLDSIFDNAEDGTPPTDYIKIDRAGDTGIISGCRFACATHEADVITIAAGILYAANITEAGISTARPS